MDVVGFSASTAAVVGILVVVLDAVEEDVELDVVETADSAEAGDIVGKVRVEFSMPKNVKALAVNPIEIKPATARTRITSPTVNRAFVNTNNTLLFRCLYSCRSFH
jgi:hypothetical protein